MRGFNGSNFSAGGQGAICDVCLKMRRRGNHDRCSKIRQQRNNPPPKTV